MKIKNKLISILVLFLYASIFINSSYAQSGSLDISFNGNGKVITPGLPTNFVSGYNAAIQTDGKILVAGYIDDSTSFDFVVVRLNTNGSVDSTFDYDGLVSTDIDSNSDDGSYALAIQTDGKIVVAGYSDNGSGYDFAVIRYKSNGSLDSTFGGDGIVTTDVGGSDDEGVSVALQSDGKIVVAGYTFASADYDFAVVRYNTDGSLDNSFDTDGITTSDINSGSFDFGSKVLVQSDGKILLAGSSGALSSDFAVVRYNSNGSLDLSFSTDGKVITDFGGNDDYGNSMALQADGKVVVVGSSDDGSNTDFALVRYNSNGTLDNSFDGDGMLIRGLTIDADEAYGVAIQSDGKILAGGSSNNGTDYDFAIARYNSNGSTDSSFNHVGRVLTDFGGDDYCGSLLVQSDGKIVAAGYKASSAFEDIAVARYTNAIVSGIASTNIIDNSLFVYPIPANEFISISLKDIEQSINADYVINDISGRIIMKGKLTETNTKIDVSGLVPGMYFLQVEGQQQGVIKIIKQ